MAMVDDALVDDPEEQQPDVVVTGNTRTCANPECPNPLPKYGEEGFHPARIYCLDHTPRPKRSGGKGKAKADGGLPASVTIDLGGKTDPKLLPVEKGAKFYLDFLPLVFGLMGDEVCSAALTTQIPAIAHQLALLSEFHPALAKAFTPSESVGEAMAWGGLFMASGPVIVAMLIHHNMLPEKMAELLGATFLAGTQVTEV